MTTDAPPRAQAFSFGLADTAAAEAGQYPLDELHWNVDAICACWDAMKPLAERLDIDPPRPHLAGFSYNHASTLGARVVFAAGSEPNVVPCITSPSDIDHLREPDDYMSSGVVPERLQTLEELRSRRADAAGGIGHIYEGPATTAGLLMGRAFFTLPYEDPARAHKLLDFVTESALNFARAYAEHMGSALKPGFVNIPDDFAGMLSPALFPEFVVPYWRRMYEGLQATYRFIHSELLRPEHLPFLTEVGVDEFDPSADQYVTPELLREQSPVPFTGRIQSWHFRDETCEQLVERYRRIAACEPTKISFYMTSLWEEEKFGAVLQEARRLGPA
jgi:hypothetical protein